MLMVSSQTQTSAQGDHSSLPGVAAAGAPHHAEPARLRWAVQERRLLGTLSALAAAFLTLSVLGQLLAMSRPHSEVIQSVVRATNMDREGNLPSLFSASLLGLAALLLWLIRRVTPGARPSRDLRAWAGLSWIFVYLCTDEYMHLHEIIMDPFRDILQASGFLRYTWVIPYGAFCLLLLIWLWPFLRRLPPGSRSRFLWAGAIFLSGTLGTELISGQVETFLGVGNRFVLALTTLEEGLEMLGIILFIAALLRHIRDYLPATTLELALPSSGPSRGR